MEVQPKKRGRPPKPKEDKPKRPRGRPPKPKLDLPPRHRGRPTKEEAEERRRAEAEAKLALGLLRDERGNFLPKSTIQSDEQMDAINSEILPKSHLYGKELDSGEKIGAIVANLTEEISNVGRRINLSDADMVQETAVRYLKSCQRTGSLPSKNGFSRACGLSHYGLDKFVKDHPNHPTTDFLMVLFDAFAEAMSQASLSGSVHPIVSIFLQKALYGVRENDPIAQPTDTPLGEAKATNELYKKYLPSYEDK